ncbi:MAG: multidrug effflux MFS transporter [Gammaproteobacteria bacterium]|nr:multidrug effflux MFS transporter [Gammaproteobacteria bacterium]
MKHQGRIIFMILFMGILAPVLIDEYAPSMPAMAADLTSSANVIQFTITMMLFGLGVGQVILGPLSDRFGRRPIILFGISLTVLASLLCIFAASAAPLLIGRFLQGLGIASAALTTTALIGDLFEGEEVNRVTGLFILIYGLVPIIAPVAGGYIQHYFNWQANFILMLAFVVAGLIFFAISMPETVDKNKTEPLHPVTMLKNYVKIISHSRYITAVIGAMFSWATIITFSLLAPFIIQDTLHYSAKAYGYIALIVGLGFLVGNTLNTFLLRFTNSKKLLAGGLLLAVIGATLIFILTLLHIMALWVIIVASLIILLGIGFAFPNYYSYAVAVFTTNLTGTANALIGALILFGTVTYSSILSAFHAHSVITLASVYLLLTVLNAASGVICLRQHRAS